MVMLFLRCVGPESDPKSQFLCQISESFQKPPFDSRTGITYGYKELYFVVVTKLKLKIIKVKMIKIVWTSNAVYAINYFIKWQLIQTSVPAI